MSMGKHSLGTSKPEKLTRIVYHQRQPVNSLRRMKLAKIITIEIDPSDASFTVNLTGFHGTGCTDVIKAFASIGETTKVIEKPEFKEKNQNTVNAGK